MGSIINLNFPIACEQCNPNQFHLVSNGCMFETISEAVHSLSGQLHEENNVLFHNKIVNDRRLDETMMLLHIAECDHLSYVRMPVCLFI